MLNKNDFEDWAEWVNNEGMIINTSVIGRLMDSKVNGGSVSLVGDAEYDIELKVSKLAQESPITAQVLRIHYAAGRPELLNVKTSDRWKSSGLYRKKYYQELTRAKLEIEQMY